ncbi:MAG: CvpA family protein [Ruminococcaceae bacterium]|nr:CvpA family protein [Oscillospiraceae bacterium]
MKKALSFIVKASISLIFLFLYYWFALPPLHWRSPAFWAFAVISTLVITVVFSLGRLFRMVRNMETVKNRKGNVVGKRFPFIPRVWLVVGGVALGVLAVFLVSSLIFSPVFCATQYKNLIQSETGDFANDVSEISWSQIPVVDRDSASRLGSRKLGEIDELVSQFEVAENYTQINFQDKPVRVTPLVYGDIFKWLRNQGEGIPAYIKVDMVTQAVDLVDLPQGMKYSESEYFMRNINRYLRFKFPTLLYDNLSFEIDEEGIPYWVASTYTYRIGLASGQDANGAVLVNAITGEATRYALADVPSWVDQVFDSDMILTQLGYYGAYQSGFWNSVFGQAGVKYPTDGYNYLAIDDDVWLYTGMTSAGGDESNVGFVLVNLRTKETTYYTVPGAEEYSAMSSAEGQEQHLGYTATFPILLNVEGRPTYFMSLKDDAGLVKKYAFVDVEQYQIVGTGDKLEAARTAYIDKLAASDLIGSDTADKEETPVQQISGTIAEIHPVVQGGNTVYYFRLNGTDDIYTAEVSLSTGLPFLKEGVTVIITCEENSFAVQSLTIVK